MNERRGRVKEKLGVGISLLLPKESRGPPGLTSLSDGRIAINDRYSFTTNALQKGFGYSPRIV